MEENREILTEQLGTVNRSIVFLLLIILSVLLSFWAVLIQREGLARAIQGRDTGDLPPVYPIRHGASSLIIGALGFFFALAIQTCRTAARSGDPAARQSAARNVWASFFVLAAALIRFCDLKLTEADCPAPAAETEAEAVTQDEDVQPD